MKDWRGKIEEEFGKSVYRTGFSNGVISSGSFVVDHITSIGGFPLGHISEVSGEAGCGKTTLILSTIRNALSLGMSVLIEDFEGTMSERYLGKLGIPCNDLSDYRVTPKSMEQGWMIIKRFCEKPEHYGGLVVVDSLAAMVPNFEIDKMEDSKEPVIGETKVGSMAQVMSIALREMTGEILRSNVCVIFVNQERANINVTGRSFGKHTPGGNALPFYASLRIQMQHRGSSTVSGDDPSGIGGEKKIVTAIKTSARVLKNKFGPSFRSGMFYIRMDGGIDNILSAIDIGIAAGKIEKKGAYYVLDPSYSGADTLGKKKISGLERTRQYFIDNPDMYGVLVDDAKNQLLKEDSNE